LGSLVEFGGQFIDFLGEVLRFLNGIMAFTGEYSWAFAIILLTIAVRILLLPLAVKQINSMRAMQKIQPELKKVQKKYKVDRSLMRTNPEKFRAQQQKQREAMMTLYQEHNVNPAAGCLPLLAQAPIFFALFRLLFSERIPELDQAGFFFISSLSDLPMNAGFGALVLAALMGGTTYLTQKQMMASNPSSAQMPQQKVLLYVMPIMLLVFSFNMPVGVLLYWVTTNVWTMGQQWLMFRNVTSEASGEADKKGK
jgi:YidC/Oxa1 family membrane protein insertase